MKVVIVEDEICIREGIKKILQKLQKQYEVLGEAGNGYEGLELIRRMAPDIVITDIRMPQMDGLQMLKLAQEEHLNVQAIVLSAYSEFEYARGAMKLGVTEYLLKPIGLPELIQALENVEEKIRRERQQKPAQIGTLEQVLRDFLEGTMTLDEEVAQYLFRSHNITPQTPFMLVCAYLGQDYKVQYERAEKDLKFVFSLQRLSMNLISRPERNCIVAVIYHFSDGPALERYMQQQLLHIGKTSIVYGCTMVHSISELDSGFQKLYPYMDWNISFDQEILISYPKIMNVQTVPCVYSIETEAKCKVAVCTNKWSKAEECIAEFQSSFMDGKLYQPKEIKECYVRFLWAMIGIAKEIGVLKQDQLPQQQILEMIANAKRREELNAAVGLVMDAVKTEQEDGVTHLTVKRVLNMIHEFYQTGITLEQISEKLNVTPEYIGTQFHKEVGMTFSAYMRNFRINRAKELLCSTDLKQYQVAEQVGYADPKYFSKVFKEVTGQLPAEYRKTYK